MSHLQANDLNVGFDFRTIRCFSIFLSCFLKETSKGLFDLYFHIAAHHQKQWEQQHRQGNNFQTNKTWEIPAIPYLAAREEFNLCCFWNTASVCSP